jgi:hypothetical protein
VGEEGADDGADDAYSDDPDHFFPRVSDLRPALVKDRGPDFDIAASIG